MTPRRSAVVALLIIVSLSLGACCSPPKMNNGWPVNIDKVAHAIVKTSPVLGADRDAANDVARLKSYYQALQKIVGTSNLEEQQIGCVECKSLLDGTLPVPDTLTFIFFLEHVGDMPAFESAMARVQSMPIRNLGFVLTFDAQPPPSAFCTKPIPTCFPNPTCVSTDSCDQNRSAPGCQRCP